MAVLSLELLEITAYSN